MKRLLPVFLVMFLASCQITQFFGKSKIPEEQMNFNSTFIDSLNYTISQQETLIDSLTAKLERSQFVSDSLYFALEEANDRVAVNTDFQIPLEIEFAGKKISLHNERIFEKFQKIYKQELKNSHRFIPRSGTYFPVFDSVFADHKVPLDVKYLAVAESGLSSEATSWVGAAGLWQFMKKTGKGYGLKINDFVDERRNTFKATIAAARYLNDNHNYLKRKGANDWLLTFCSYNAGAGSIARVVREQGGTSFQDLILRVDETNKYLWRAIAIKLIFENQEEIFGKTFEKNKSLYDQIRFVDLKLNGHYKIDDWAKAQGTVVSKVWEYNPWIKIYKRKRRRYTPINDVVLPPGEYRVAIPKDSISNLDKVATIENKFMKKNSGYFQTHIVKSGDSLYKIASKYKTSVSKIKSINGLKSNIIRPGQKLKLYGKASANSTSNYSSSTKTYTVKSGDSIAKIAKKYKTSVKKIKQLNNLKSDMIRPGQKLLVSGKNYTSTKKSNHTYIVKSGDSISKIASKLGIKSSTLIAKNNLKTTSRNGRKIVHISPGQKLVY